MKEVVHPNGITLPGGQEVPFGAWLGVSISGISKDERYYPDPHKYDPFRFSRARTEVAILERNKKNGNTDHAATTTTIATTKATDKVVSNEKDVVDADSLTETIIGKVDDPAARNKLNGSWLSTTTEDFGVFGFGRRSWYVIFFSFSFSYFSDVVLPPFLPLYAPFPSPRSLFKIPIDVYTLTKKHKITQPGAMVCIPHHENDSRLYRAQLRDSTNP